VCIVCSSDHIYRCSASHPGLFVIVLCLLLFYVCYCFMFIIVCQGTTDANELKLQSGTVHNTGIFRFLLYMVQYKKR